MKINLLKLQEYILYLLPIAIVSGPFFSDLIIVVSGLIFLTVVDYKKEKKYFLNIFSILFFLWCIIILISSTLSNDIFFSLRSSLFYFRFGLFVLSVWYLINNVDKFLSHFKYILLLTCSVVITDSLIQFLSGSNIFGYESINNRLSSFFKDELVVGNFLSRLFPLCIALLIITEKNNKYLIYFIGIFIISTTIVVFLSGERVAFFNQLLALIIFVFLIFKYRKLKIYISFILIMIIGAFIFLNSEISKRMINLTIEQISDENRNIYLFSEEHEIFYRSSLKMFQNSPLIGNGPNMYRKLCSDENYFITGKVARGGNPPNSCSTHPHGTFFQIMAEVGLAGSTFHILILAFILIKFLKKFIWFKNSKEYLSDYEVLLYLSILINLWPLIPSMNFFNNWISIIYYLPIGFLLSYLDKKGKISIYAKIL